MKKFLLVFLMLVIGTMAFAQTNEIKSGRTYVLKSTDGSGQVPLYRYGADIPALFLPEGTEIKPISSYSNGIEVRHEDRGYIIREENFGEETAASVKDREGSKIFGILFVLIQFGKTGLIVLLIVLMYKRNKYRSVPKYKTYYNAKRKQFPWLVKWLKNYPEIEKEKSIAEASTTALASTLSVIGILLLGMFVSFIIGFGGFLTEILCIVGAVVISELISRRWSNSKNPGILSVTGDEGLTLECPSCGCPHAWTLLGTQDFIKDISTSEKTITTTMSDGSEKVEKRTLTVYYGRHTNDFKCDNCGHTIHGDFETSWVDDPPSTDYIKRDPPKRLIYDV